MTLPSPIAPLAISTGSANARTRSNLARINNNRAHDRQFERSLRLVTMATKPWKT